MEVLGSGLGEDGRDGGVGGMIPEELGGGGGGGTPVSTGSGTSDEVATIAPESANA